MSATEMDAVYKVLTGYYEAYGRDSAAASAFFGEPIRVVLPSEVVLLSTRAELVTFFDRFVAAHLTPNGYSHSKVGEYHVRLLNSATALCSAVAIRMKTDATEMQRTGFTYLLRKSEERWQILEIIATDLDKLTR
jgi:SnoaL-like domain